MQLNPFWGRGVMLLKQLQQNQVLNLVLCGCDMLFLDNGLELLQGMRVPVMQLSSMGFTEVDPQLFHKLMRMLKLTNVSAKALLAPFRETLEHADALAPVQGTMACLSGQHYRVIRVLEADALLPKYRVQQFTIASGLVLQEATELSVKQLTLDHFVPVEDAVFEGLMDLWQRSKDEVSALLQEVVPQELKTLEEYSREYAQGVADSMHSVYDGMDIHK